MSDVVGLVIVSHSADVAKGTTAMVRQMVGEDVPTAFAGGDPAGGLGTDVGAIKTAIEQVWSEAGVAVLVDLGGAEMNAEMAIQMFSSQQRARIRICNAPVVEGAVVAAVEASAGSSLGEVCVTAESALL